MREIEQVRSTGQIGSSLAAVLQIQADPAAHELLSSLGEELRFAFIVSQAQLEPASTEQLQIAVTPTADQKCERCWHFEASVGQDEKHPQICQRCISNIEGPGEQRKFV